jgi:hypothetical protein
MLLPLKKSINERSRKTSFWCSSSIKKIILLELSLRIERGLPVHMAYLSLEEAIRRTL